MTASGLDPDRGAHLVRDQGVLDLQPALRLGLAAVRVGGLRVDPTEATARVILTSIVNLSVIPRRRQAGRHRGEWEGSIPAIAGAPP
jgi:hypothetical protein